MSDRGALVVADARPGESGYGRYFPGTSPSRHLLGEIWQICWLPWGTYGTSCGRPPRRAGRLFDVSDPTANERHVVAPHYSRQRCCRAVTLITGEMRRTASCWRSGMSGEALNQYYRELCDYVRANVEEACSDDAFRWYIEQDLDDRLLGCIGLAADESDSPEDQALFSVADLIELENAVRLAWPKKKWSPSPPIHKRKVHCVPEITVALTKNDAEDWSRESSKFAQQLEEENVSLEDGVGIVTGWIICLRRLLVTIERSDVTPEPAQPSGKQSTSQDSTRKSEVTSDEETYLETMRDDIAKHENGKRMTMNALVAAAGVNRAKGLAALRQLRDQGEPLVVMPSPATAKPATPAQVEPSEAPPAVLSGVFSFADEYWTVTFAGKTVTPEHLDGYFYIAQLLRKPHTELKALELRLRIIVWKNPGRPVGDADPASQSLDILSLLSENAGECVGEADLSACRASLADYKSKFETARIAGESEQAAEASDEIEKLEKFIRSNSDHRGKPRLISSNRKKAGDMVRNAITCALTRLESIHPRLHAHLSRHLEYGTSCRYRPPGPTEWET